MFHVKPVRPCVRGRPRGGPPGRPGRSERPALQDVGDPGAGHDEVLVAGAGQDRRRAGVQARVGAQEAQRMAECVMP